MSTIPKMPPEQYPPVTYMIILVILITSVVGLLNKKIYHKLLLHPYSIIKRKEYYRAITGDLVHNDVLHLGLNLFILYLVCADLEETIRSQNPYGSWMFLSIYLGSYAAGAAYTIIRYRNQPEYSSAGASGSIMGCMMSFMILAPNYVAVYLPLIGGVTNLYMALGYIVAMTYYQRKQDSSQINHGLHFFSALGGIIITILYYPDILKKYGV